MKVCIPTKGSEGLTEQVFGHFGSAPFFTVFDTNTKEVEVIQNLNQHHTHGSCKPTAAIQDKEIDVVVCAGMGARALMKLNAANIKAYKVEGNTVEQAIEKFQKGELVELTPVNTCTLHNCHQ